MNKQLWSPSYMFFMAGCSGYLLVIFYAVYDLQLGSIDASAPTGQRALCIVQRGLRFAFTPGTNEAPQTRSIFLQQFLWCASSWFGDLRCLLLPTKNLEAYFSF